MLESMDELDCALITMRLAEDEDGELTEELKRLVVRPEEISMRRQELQNEVSLYEGELKDSQRQLNYLRSLAAVSEKGAASRRRGRMVSMLKADCGVFLIGLESWTSGQRFEIGEG